MRTPWGRTHREGSRGRTTQVRQKLTESVATLDKASIVTRGQPTIYDVVIAGARSNRDIYDGNPRYMMLDTEMIPLAIETLGAAGEEFKEVF